MNIVRSSVAVVIISALGAVACSSAETSKSVEALGSSTEPVTVVKTHTEWNGGSVNAFASGPSSNLQFSASENKSTGKPRTASLTLFGSGSDPTSQVCFTGQYCDTYDPTGSQCVHFTDYSYCNYTRTYYLYGYGEIPSGDFLVDKHGARLTTNLANDPGLMVQRCTSDTVAQTYSCAPATGTINVRWTDNGNFSSENDNKSSTTYKTPYSTFTSKSSGTWKSSSADVSGTALGNPVNGSGDISQSSGKSVSKDIFEGPPSGPDAGFDAAFGKD